MDNLQEKQTITVQTTIGLPVETVWKYWTEPEHIKKWNHASQDWHTTYAENDLRVGGKFLSRMEAKDNSFGFDFFGIYDEVRENELLVYTLGDERRVRITFTKVDGNTAITETFEAEDENPIEMQQGGWQAILDNFKKHAENEPK